MTPHATSQCCRTLQRQITLPKDSVWISDSALASAFARYCLVSKTWRRHVGNVPGPLESRRRMGKRQLGDLSAFQHAAAPPPWVLSGLVDFSQWHWEPPRSPSAREREENQLAMKDSLPGGSIATLVPQWLKELAADVTADPPPPPPPPDFYDTPIPRSQLFRAELDKYLQPIPTASVDMVASESQSFFRALEQSIYLGDIPPSDLSSITADIWDALVVRLGDTPVGYQLYRSLCSALVTGIANSKVFRADVLDADFWDTLLMRLAELPPNDESCDVFNRILTATSHECHGALVPGILAFLEQSFAAWSSPQSVETMAGSQPARPWHQIQRIASALAAINPEYHDSLVKSANDAFQKTFASSSRKDTMGYSWLSVLAQMPLVRQGVVFDMVVRLSAHMPLTATDISSLLLAQWKSRGYLAAADKIMQKYEENCAGNHGRAMASLALAVFRYNKSYYLRKGLFNSLWRLLWRLDRVDDMGHSLKVMSKKRRVPRSLVQALAVASGDHAHMLRLKDLYTKSLRKPGGPEWDPALFRWRAESIVQNHALPSGAIWNALDIDRLDRPQGDLRARRIRHRGTYGAQRAAIVTKLARMFGDDARQPPQQQQQRPRVAFRQVSQCVRFLEEVIGVVPPSVIEALYHVVSRDLVEGRPGRTTRLRWFLSVVERNHGSHIGLECRRALRSWRYRLTQLWLERRRGRGTNEKP
ncbi:hypothetical protein QBC39DRAFT_342604 [Podospora conica]|nr:hypothetical protein QBC39DRAFT_342604 [Schizothecium conicum]